MRKYKISKIDGTKDQWLADFDKTDFNIQVTAKDEDTAHEVVKKFVQDHAADYPEFNLDGKQPKTV